MGKYLLLLLPLFTFSQVKMPNAPQPNQMQHYGTPTMMQPPNPMDMFYGTGEQQRINQQNAQIIREVEQNEKLRVETLKQIRQEVREESDGINYNFPSFANIKGTEYYRQVYDKMINLNVENYSVKEVNFDIENAFYQNKNDKAQFDQIIKNSGDFIFAKMKELNYDTNNNVAKNYMLFQFFSENLKLKSGLNHLPFKYDFDDYMGEKDHSKMFVSKLLATKTGQCHSMPLLYLILAEQIGAEAFLSLSPNHSFIKFKDENNKWYNIELTNGMFTASSFLINSGYIKAEALQNEIYLQELTKKQLLSHFFVDLAEGYLHKFGFDSFVEKTIDKALQLYPNNVSAQIIKGNLKANQFEFVANQLNINPRNREQLQKIKNYPKVISLLQIVNIENKKIDQLGYTEMPKEAYEKWLGSLKEAKRKQENQTFNQQFKGKIIIKGKD